MPVQIRTYQPADAKIKALVYSPSGIGKTTLGATAPKPLFISAEAGLLSVADKNVNYVEIKSLQDPRDVYTYLSKGGQGYETVVIDSLTEIQSFIIRNITGGQRMPQKQEWSDFGFEMTKILRAYRDLPLHVIFLALETDRGGDEDGDKSVYMPDLYGKVRTAVAAFMDFIGRMAHFAVQEGDARVPKRGSASCRTSGSSRRIAAGSCRRSSSRTSHGSWSRSGRSRRERERWSPRSTRTGLPPSPNRGRSSTSRRSWG